MFGCLCIGSIRVTDLGLNGGRIEGPCLSHARREKRRRWYKQARQPNTGQHVSSGESHRVMVAAADPRQVRRLATNADWQDMPDHTKPLTVLSFRAAVAHPAQWHASTVANVLARAKKLEDLR
jgi:hypothetical protein